MTRICVIGEALIDIVVDPLGDIDEHVGGSPLNVAAGLARLGQPTEFATTIGHDPHGDRIVEHLARQGVRLAPNARRDGPTSTARADLDETGAATYTFDLRWDLPSVGLAAQTGHVHIGSIGAVLAPGAATALDAVRFMAQHGTVSYDPNIRPGIMGPMDELLPRIEEIIELSTVVKASLDDIDALYPGQEVDAVLGRWCDLGPRLAVATLGAHGVGYRVASSGEVATASTRARHVMDTVGAGDSFMAGLLSGLMDADLLGSKTAGERLAAVPLSEVEPAIDRAQSCAAVTVSHPGAYAPTRDELS
ncbi:MAG: carbohydrate kinase family protein [Nostocoides sp.]